MATTRLLERIGLTGYAQRSFWERARRIAGSRIQLYRYMDVDFEMAVYLVRRKLLHVDGWLPVDYIDCQLMRSRCFASPQGQALMAYVEGKAMGSEIKINVVRLLSILNGTSEGLAFRVIDGLEQALEGKGLSGLTSALLDAVKLDAVRIMLPKVPSSIRDLASMSPALRKKLLTG